MLVLGPAPEEPIQTPTPTQEPLLGHDNIVGKLCGALTQAFVDWAGSHTLAAALGGRLPPPGAFPVRPAAPGPARAQEGSEKCG